MSDVNDSKRIAADILIAALQKPDIDKIFTHGLHSSNTAHVDVIDRIANAYRTLHETVEAKDDRKGDS